MNEALCENNMAILRLMSEEVFDFSSGQMTQAKIKELKTSLNNEFVVIYQLCEYVLDTSQKPTLLLATLQTLLRFLNWIPLGYIFETKMIDTLVFKVRRIASSCTERMKQFFPVPIFRNVTLECLTEIASLNIGTMYDAQFEKLFCGTMAQLRNLIRSDTNIAAAFANGSEEEQNFIHFLSLFLTGFFKCHLALMEKPEHHAVLLEAHSYLANVSLVDDTEIFKICLEYWNKLVT